MMMSSPPRRRDRDHHHDSSYWHAQASRRSGCSFRRLGFVVSAATVLAVVMSAGYYRSFDSILVALYSSSKNRNPPVVPASSSSYSSSSSSSDLSPQGSHGGRVDDEFRVHGKRNRSPLAPSEEASGPETDCTYLRCVTSGRIAILFVSSLTLLFSYIFLVSRFANFRTLLRCCHHPNSLVRHNLDRPVVAEGGERVRGLHHSIP
jgi:hypothetical protein